LDPKFPEPRNGRGNALSKKGDDNKAIIDYDEAIRLDPKFAPAYNDRGLVWYRKGDYDKAIADYDEVVSI
jgi:tetratricopeptide (TPR) repeat protein